MAAESQITATPAHEISISSKLRPTLAQCSCRTGILLRKTAGEPNVFQISAFLVTTFRVIFSPAGPMRICGLRVLFFFWLGPLLLFVVASRLVVVFASVP